MNPRARDSAAGETFVELLISIAILGIAGAGVVGVVLMGSTGSAQHEENTVANRLLRNWAESLEQAQYRACLEPADVTLPPEPKPIEWTGSGGVFSRTIKGVPYTASVQKVEYWNTAQATFTRACSADSGLQRLTLSMQVPGVGMAGTDEELVLTKRNPCRTLTEPSCQ